MGSSASGSSAAESSKQRSQTFARESVASAGRTVTTSSGARAPAPPPRPDFAYQNRSMIGRIGQDIAMGVDDLVGQRSDRYTPAEWQAYDIRTEQTRARQAAEQESRQRDRDDRPAPVAPADTGGGGGGGGGGTGTPVAPVTPTAPPTPGIDQAQAELERRVEDLVRDPGERAAAERARGTPEMDVGTAAGAQAERAAVIAETQAEQEAADALLKGRRSTILTTPGGLLAPEEGETTEARSLLGGRRRRAA